MRYFLVISFIIIGPLYVFGQNTIQTSALTQIDSLNALILSNPHDTTKARAYHKLAEQYNLINEKDSAVSVSLKAFKLLDHIFIDKKKGSDLNIYADLKLYYHRHYAHYLRLSGKLKESSLEHSEALKFSNEFCMSAGYARTLRSFGQFNYETGRYKVADSLLLIAEQLQIDLKNDVELCRVIATMGLLQSKLGNPVKSIEYYKRAIAIQQKTNAPDLCISYNDLATNYLHQGMPNKALEYAFKALHLADSLNNQIIQAQTFTVIGGVYYQLKDWDKAREYAFKSLDLLKPNGDPKSIGSIYVSLSQLELSLANHDKALAYAQQALKILRPTGAISPIIATYKNIGSIYGRLRNPLQRVYLDSALSLAQSTGSTRVIPEILRAQGKVAHREGRFNDAIDLAKQVLIMCTKSKQAAGRRAAYQLLYKSYEKQQNFTLAFEAYSHYINIRDSLTNLASTRAAIRKETQYEISLAEIKSQQVKDSARYEILQEEKKVIAKNAEIKDLEHQKEIKNRTILGISIGAILLLIGGLLWFRNIKQKRRFEQANMTQQLMTYVLEIDLLQATIASHTEQRTALKTSVLSGDINQYLQDPLSKRELEVLEELTKGKDNKNIAENLFISVNTVRTHLSKIYEKLDVDNRTQAVNKASNLAA